VLSHQALRAQDKGLLDEGDFHLRRGPPPPQRQADPWRREEVIASLTSIPANMVRMRGPPSVLTALRHPTCLAIPP
jgi:hypothetical protein